jgi:hypothetical protein
MSDLSELPDFVSAFLQCSTQLQVLRQQEKIYKDKMTELQTEVGQWLQCIPSYEVNLKFDEEQILMFGENGKLRFGIERRKEYLSKNNLVGYLSSFFSQIYPDKSEQDIEQLSKAAGSHVWQSRKTTKNKPTVLRTYSKKRKRSDN